MSFRTAKHGEVFGVFFGKARKNECKKRTEAVEMERTHIVNPFSSGSGIGERSGPVPEVICVKVRSPRP